MWQITVPIKPARKLCLRGLEFTDQMESIGVIESPLWAAQLSLSKINTVQTKLPLMASR